MTTKIALRAWLLLVLLTLGLVVPADSVAQTDSSLIVLISGPDYNVAKNIYTGSFSVNNPNQLAYLIYMVEDADAGTVAISETQVSLGGFNSRRFELDGAKLKAERKYLLRVQAVDGRGNLIPRPGENYGQDSSEQYLLASKEFVHQPPGAPRFDFKIDAINADLDTEQLIVRLSVPGGFQVLKYDGFIVDDTGQQVGAIPSALYPGPELLAPLPEAMLLAIEARKYRVTLRLYTQDQQQAEQAYEVVVIPPPRPRLGQRILGALDQTPLIALAIVGVIAAVVTTLILVGRRQRNFLPPIGPPVHENTLSGNARIRRNQLRVRVVQSPGTSRGLQKIVKSFPCTVGKDPGCAICIDDSHVSRRHLEFTLRDGYFFVTDLGSSNGTFINDDQLRTGATMPIAGAISLRLGDRTIIDVEAS